MRSTLLLDFPEAELRGDAVVVEQEHVEEMLKEE
jgi:hypothetical protein